MTKTKTETTRRNNDIMLPLWYDDHWKDRVKLVSDASNSYSINMFGRNKEK